MSSHLFIIVISMLLEQQSWTLEVQ